MTMRDDIVTAARACIGTPFQHRGRTRGLGLDCVGLIILVARECGFVAPDFDVPPYTLTPDGSMLALCDEHMTRLRKPQLMLAGDVIVLATDIDPQHLGIVANHIYGGPSIIHATNSRGTERVVETRLVFSRAQKFVAAYSFNQVAE